MRRACLGRPGFFMISVHGFFNYGVARVVFGIIISLYIFLENSKIAFFYYL